MTGNEYQLEYQRQWRQKLKDKGLCVRCREPNNNGKATCDRCLTQQRDGYQYYIERGLCPNCGGKKKESDKTLCEYCRSRALGYYYKRKEERNKNHQCVDCSKPVAEGEQRCSACLRKAAQRERDAKKKRRKSKK